MASAPDLIRQAAAIPIHSGRVCLVMSSSGKRWIIPKGCIESGQSAAETALLEAWEEAGLLGILHPEPVGSYLYEKYALQCHVTVFLMQVTQVSEDWPERSRRPRRWWRPPQALVRIQDPGLRKLMHQVLLANTKALPA